MRWAAGIFIVLLLGGGVWAYFHFHGTISPTISSQPAAAAAASQPIIEVPAAPLGQEYKNTKYRFSVSMPAGFKAAELPNDAGGTTITLQDTGGQGIQIYITPYPDDTKVITADDVRSSIPDMKVTQEQDVDIGNDYKGVAFMSNNDAFEGASREVWFVFRGNLYQISTYARFDPLLKEMFGTWKFF